jgi:hypothetical protein
MKIPAYFMSLPPKKIKPFATTFQTSGFNPNLIKIGKKF